jgi:ClpP class serine protease
MLRQQFLLDIQSSILMIHSSGHEMIAHIANAIHAGIFNPKIIEQTIVSARGDLYHESENDENRNPFDDWQDGSIAIIPLVGIMMKSGYWWSYGVDYVAEIIRQAYSSERISAVILKTDTPGGATDALFLIEEVLSEKVKPTYGYVDGMAASCGYIALSYCDKIYAINDMALVGSIGVYVQLLVPNKERAYYTVKEVYPDESKDKNAEVREALEGKEDKMKEFLSKAALKIREKVKKNRPGIANETLTGQIYYAYEAVPQGLIDGIRTMAEVVGELQKITENRKQILSII